MTSKRLYKILVPSVTFLGGIFIQLLIERWVSLGTITTLTLVLVLVSLAILFTASLHILESLDTRFGVLSAELNQKFELVDKQLLEIFRRSGLRVECIEDREDHASHIRATELIKAAKQSITIVSPWSPFLEKKRDTTIEPLINYYKAIEEKIHRTPEQQ